MDKTTALDNLQKFLEENSNFKPTDGFTLSDPFEYTIDNNKIYYVCWSESDGRIARGGYSYYVLPDGTVHMPAGGSGQPETAEAVYARWQKSKADVGI
jgi:hypothetical protein